MYHLFFIFFGAINVQTNISPYIRLYIVKSAWFKLKEYTRFITSKELEDYKYILAQKVISELKRIFDVDYSLEDLLFINSASSALQHELQQALVQFYRGESIIGTDSELLERVVVLVISDQKLKQHFSKVHLLIRCSDALYYNDPHTQQQLTKLYLPNTTVDISSFSKQLAETGYLTVRLTDAIKHIVTQLGN